MILGKVGRNFGAGMSGGVAYVLDKDLTFTKNCNGDYLNIGPVKLEEDKIQLRLLIENHFVATSSPLAKRILETWNVTLTKFKKVLPEEYRQALLRLEKEQLETV